MHTLALYQQESTNLALARRRCKMIAAAASAGAAILPLSVLLGARASPGGSQTAKLLILSSTPFAHRRRRSPNVAGQRPPRGSEIMKTRASE